MADVDVGILAEAQREVVRALAELASATTANTQALTGFTRELGGLPGLVAALVGGDKGGGSALGSVLRSGLGLVPLGLKLAGLFRSRPAEPAPPQFYSLPPSLSLEVANTENSLSGFPRVDRGDAGRMRAVAPEPRTVVQPQITVQVSAMDSRSFLDRSEDIARAVRDAMLHMHPVNDFISEL
jgi:hypothetical protein